MIKCLITILLFQFKILLIKMILNHMQNLMQNLEENFKL